MSSEIWNPGFSASAEQPADDSKYSSAAQPASLCLFARPPPEIWRQLIGLLSYSDVAACSCSASHEDTKRLLMEYMRRRCCISTFKRLLVEHAGNTYFQQTIMRDPDSQCIEKWDPRGTFWNNSHERKFFWRRAIEMIFLYEPKLLEESQRCDALIQQDYIHSCGVLFAPKACATIHRHLQRKFRAGCRVPIIAQSWYRMRGFHYCPKGLTPGTHIAGTAILRERRESTVLDSLLI